MKPISDRNKTIVELYNKGDTLNSLSKIYPLTKEGIRQVIRRYGKMRPRDRVPMVDISCTTCQAPILKKKYANVLSIKKHFCTMECRDLHRQKIRKLYKERVNKYHKEYIRRYRETSIGNERTTESRKKYLASPKYLIWYKNFYGHEKGTIQGVQRINTHKKCLVSDCPLMTNRRRISKRDGEPLYSSTCYKHNKDGAVKLRYSNSV